MNHSSDSIKKIFEDDQILVLNKPAHLVTNRAESVKTETVQDWFCHNYPEHIKHAELVKSYDPDQADLFLSRSGMVHRLDKDTSGVLLWAKNPASMLHLMDQFKQRSIHKTYLALVHGRFKVTFDTIKLPLDRLPKNRKKFGVVAGGKMTETDYQVIKLFKPMKSYNEGFSLLELEPKTGRTHQLRVVLKHLHHPIVGDTVYVGRKRAKQDAAWCPRQFLHAASISFTHPTTNQDLQYQAPLTEDLTAVLKELTEDEISN